MSKVFQKNWRVGAGPSDTHILPGLRLQTEGDSAVLYNSTAEQTFYIQLEPSGFSLWSCLKQLLDGTHPRLNVEAIRHHLRFGETVNHRLVWAGVHLLLPGSRLTLGPAGVTGRYAPWTRGGEAYDESVIGNPATILRAALPSEDHQVVLEFSGGTDSTAIAYALAGRDKVQAITWVDPNTLGASDIQHAKHIARKLGLPHRLASMAPEHLFRLPAGTYWPDRPSLSLFSQDINDRLIREAAGEGAPTVVLNGHGGDHIFLDPPSPAPVVDLLARGRVAEALRYYCSLVTFHGQGFLTPLRYRKLGQGIGKPGFTLTPGKRLHRRMIQQACFENSIWNNCGLPYKLIHPFTHPAMLRYALSHPPHAYVGERQSRLPFRQAMNIHHGTDDFSRVSKGHLTGVFQRAIRLQHDALAGLLEQGTGQALALFAAGEMLMLLKRAASGSEEVSPVLLNALSLELFLQHWARILGVSTWQTAT